MVTAAMDAETHARYEKPIANSQTTFLFTWLT
jgi:hypothetical protein